MGGGELSIQNGVVNIFPTSRLMNVVGLKGRARQASFDLDTGHFAESPGGSNQFSFGRWCIRLSSSEYPSDCSPVFEFAIQKKT
jgi:hypothetical protein